MERRSIGELNGKWSLLFRAMLSLGAVLLPFIVVLNVWFVTAIYDIKLKQIEINARFDAVIAKGPFYTREMARSDNLQLRENIIREIKNEHPPEWLTKQIQENTKDIHLIEQRINAMKQ